MSNLIRLCPASALPAEGEACEILFNERQFCVARNDGQLAVLDNICPHQEGPLGQGFIEKGRIVCPWHAWAFDLKTGEAQHTHRARVPVYPATVVNDALMVELPDL